MNVGVVGLGYVGTVSLAALARLGHQAWGWDTDGKKLAGLAAGVAPVHEAGLDRLIRQGQSEGRLHLAHNLSEMLANTDLALVCVGTPKAASGAPDLRFVEHLAVDMERVLRTHASDYTVVIRSTVPPGTVRRLCRESALHWAHNPEFLREGSAVGDFMEPPFTLVGSSDPVAVEHMRTLYRDVRAPFLILDADTTELIKYIANAWHATKICFSNEVGRLAKHFGVDGRLVMEVLVQDAKLNVSAAYLRPGFAYGGSCLPKDVSALVNTSRSAGLVLPLLESLAVTNQVQISAAIELITRFRVERVTVLGLAFKQGTDDLRESPAVALCQALSARGLTLRVFDPTLSRNGMPDTAPDSLHHALAPTLAAALEGTELVIVTYASLEFQEVWVHTPASVPIVDLAGAFAAPPEGRSYHALYR